MRALGTVLRATVAALFVLAVGGVVAAWLVPPMLDWNRYRGDIATLVSERIGRAVRIDGRVSLVLLPEPTLAAAQVLVGDGAAGLSVAELRLRLGLGSLLAGRIDAREIVLRGPDLRLPWPLGTPDGFGRAAWVRALEARVEGGTLSVGGLVVSGIDATLATAPDTGSVSLAGTAMLSGEAWHMTARLGRPGPDGAAGLDVTLDGQGHVQGLGATFSGQLAGDGRLAGRIAGGGPDLSRLLPAPPVPFRAEGRVSLAGGVAVADELAAEIAGSPAVAGVALHVGKGGRLDVSLAASRLDFDAWLPALRRAAAEPEVLPAGLPMALDLSVEAGTLGGGTVRALRGAAWFDAAGVRLSEVAAILPGDARLRLSARSDRAARLEGTLGLEAPKLRSTLAWLESLGAPKTGLVASMPPGVLRTADLRARFVAEGGSAPMLALSDVDGTLDDTRIAGTLALRPGAREAAVATLRLDDLDLDAWLAAPPSGLAALPGWVGAGDVGLAVTAARARYRGRVLAPFALEADAAQGRVALQRLEAETSGLHVTASGAVGAGGRISDGRVELSLAPGAVAPALLALRPEWARVALRLPNAPATLSVSAAGPPEAVALKLEAGLGDLRLDAQPVLDTTTGAWTSQVALHHPGAPRLLEWLGIPGTASWLGDGSFSLRGTVASRPGRVALDGFEIAAGSLRAEGALALERSEGVPRLTGQVTAETLPLPLPYPRSPEPFPVGALDGWQADVKLHAGRVLAGLSPVLDRSAADARLQDGRLVLDKFTASLAGGALSGRIEIDASGDVPQARAALSLAGAVVDGPVFDMPLDLVAGTLDGTATLTAQGHAPGALLASLSGAIRIMARDGRINGVDLGRMLPELEEPSLSAALTGGVTPFAMLDLSVSLKDGALHFDDAGFSGPAGDGRLSGVIDLAGRREDLRLMLRPAVAEPPEIGLRLGGAPADPVRVGELGAVLPWRVKRE